MDYEKLQFWKRGRSILGLNTGSSKHTKRFRLVLSFYTPEGADLSMALACLSAYAKKHIPNIEVFLAIINTTLNTPAHTVSGFAERVGNLQPDLVGVSCMSPHWHSIDPYLRALKSAIPRVPILLGGYQAILAPDETIRHPAVDYICVGDGEKSLVALIQRILLKSKGLISGLWEKGRAGEIYKTSPVLFEDLGNSPFPDYSIYERNGSLRELGLSVFGPQNLFILPIMTGRGCPYCCTYCCNTTLLKIYRGKGKFIRKYNLEYLVEELCRLRDRYKVDFFEFWDEFFYSDAKFAYNFLELYQKHIHLPFSVMCRVEMMDDHFCRAAREAGCHTIAFGIESGSESYRLKYLGRKMTNAQIITAAENANKFGIQRVTFNIVGMPFETKQDMMETLELNKKIQPEFFFFFTYIPLKGTPLYDITEENGLLLDTDRDFMEGNRTGEYRLNIREFEIGINQADFSDVCMQMRHFQSGNNRLRMESSEKGRLWGKNLVHDIL